MLNSYSLRTETSGSQPAAPPQEPGRLPCNSGLHIWHGHVMQHTGQGFFVFPATLLGPSWCCPATALHLCCPCLQVPQAGPSELTQRLLECFTCNHTQVQQELTSLRQQLAQQQQQITELTAHNSQLMDAAGQESSTILQLRSQVLELQRQLQQQTGVPEGQQQEQ